MREYSVNCYDQTIAGALTLVGFRPPSDVTIEIIRMWVKQHENETSAQQSIQVYRQASAYPTMASGVTPAKLKESDPVSKLVSGTSMSSAGNIGILPASEGGGTKTSIISDAFNAVTGWLWLPTEPERIQMSPASANIFGIWFPDGPGTNTGWDFGFTYRELG